DATNWWLVDLRGNVGTFSPVTISPTSATFTSGVWNGNITVTQAATGMHLHADDGSGRTGDSSNFDVIQRAVTLGLPSDVQESDGSVSGTVSVSVASSSDLVINLSSSDSARLGVPATVTIPAGQTQVSLPLSVIDNTL